MPNVYQQAAKFRRELIARDAEAAQAMTDAYAGILARMQREWAALVETFDENVSDWHLRRDARFKALIAQIERELAFYAQVVEMRVTGRQIQEALLGAQEAAAMVQTVSLGASFNTLNTGAVQAIVANLQDASPLSAVLKDFAGSNAAYIREALLYSVAAGRNPRTLAREISRALELPRKRALTIARTETLRAYRQASQATFEANGDIVKQWRWVAAKSSRTCLNCLSRDGSLHPTSEIIPAHPNCIPAGAVIHAPGIHAASSRFYSGDVVEFETIRGHRLTVTPNHPVLTLRGWIAAGMLDESDYVISTSVPDRVTSAVSPNNKNVPSAIEQIFQSLSESAGVFSVSVPASSENFHGDGMGSDVYVVGPNGLLRSDVNAAAFQEISQKGFLSGNTEPLFLSSFSDLAPFGEADFSAANSSLSGKHEPSFFFGRARVGQNPVSLGIGAQCDSCSNQPRPDDIATGLVFFSESVFGNARLVSGNDVSDWQFDVFASRRGAFESANAAKLGSGAQYAAGSQFVAEPLVSDAHIAAEIVNRFAAEITIDRIVKIKRSIFSGHVYNLQTETGWYIAEGIITHNCRCVMTPVTRFTPAPKETGAQWFARQSPATQREMMGARAYELFEQKKITLSDFEGRKDDDKWGAITYQRSLKQIVKLQARRKAA